MNLEARENTLCVIRHEAPAHVPLGWEAVLPVYHRDALFYRQNGDPALTRWDDAWGVEFALSDPAFPDSAYPVVHPLGGFDGLDSFSFPDPDDPALMRGVEQAIARADRSRCLIVAFNPAVMFVRSWLIMGMEKLFEGLILRPADFARLLDRIADYQVRIAERYLEQGVDGAQMGDDVGTSTALMMDPRQWRVLVKPRLKRVIDTYKSAGRFVVFHCCGRVMDILDDLIEMGVDVLHPVQAGANDLAVLRQKTRGRMALFGGIDADAVMRRTPVEVEVLTREAMLLFGGEGDYIAWPDQDLPFPKQNLLAVERAVRRHGAYRLEAGRQVLSASA